MSKKVAGINLEIGGNTAGLNKALSDTDKQLRKTANELKDVERYLKLDPGNVELLAQKEKLLADQISLTSKRAEILEKAQKAADKAIADGTDLSEEQYRKLKREIIATENQIKELEDQAEKSGEGFTVLKGAVASFAGDIASDLVSSIGAATEESREFRNEMALLEAAGTAHGYTTEQTSEAYKYLYSILGDETAARTALNNAQALGLSQSDLMSLLQSGIGVWGAYGDSIPIDGLMEAINETSKVGQITGVLADALNWAGINEDAFNEKLKACSSEQERQKLIAETLNGEYAGLADNYMKNNEELVKFNKNTLRQNEATAEIGEKLQPIQDKLTEIKINCLDKIAEAFGFIQEHSTVFTVLLTLIGSLTTGIAAYNGVQAVKNILDAAQTSTLWGAVAAQLGLNAAMLASPITWIVALIVGLVAAFVILWNKCEGFRNFWIEAWDKIKSIFFTVVGFIKENWKELTTFLVNPVAGAVALLYKLNPKFKEWVDGLIAKIKGWFSGIKDIGKNLIEGLWNGIGDKVEWLKGKVKGVVDKIKGWFTGKDGFDTHSPSKWSEKIGNFLMEGLAIGITEDMSVEEALKKKVDNLKSFISNELGITDSDIKLADAEYNLWELKNPEATDEDKNNKQISLLMKKIQAQSEAVRIANDALWESKQLTGENSAESREYQLQLINERIELEKLTAEMQEILSLRQKMYTYNITDSVNQLKTSINAISYMRMNNTARAIGMKEGQTVNVTQNYYGYKGTIAENNAAMKKTIRNMEVSLA